jgi:hypothetical protein
VKGLPDRGVYDPQQCGQVRSPANINPLVNHFVALVVGGKVDKVDDKVGDKVDDEVEDAIWSDWQPGACSGS